VSEASTKSALRFVLLLGAVSLFADVAYEGARSVTGPFLATLGATGAIVGAVAGLGELAGYGLRLVSGLLSDHTRRYWAITLVGYAVSLLAIPLLALAGRWEIAAALIVAERLGKALRSPARDAMLSHAASGLGRGWAFGLHEALDQTGAIAGPLIVAGIVHLGKGWRAAFAALAAPALLALALLVYARFLYPRPDRLEAGQAPVQAGGLGRHFWLYLGAVALVAAGYVDFPLAAYHFQKDSVMPAAWIPVLYAVAMGTDALAALALGRIFDRVGLATLALVSLLSACFAPLIFLGGVRASLAGMALWGIGMGAQESVMRAAVGGMVASNRRATAYGIFNAGYGVAWFLGSALMGILYDVSTPALIAFSAAVQVCAAPLFLVAARAVAAQKRAPGC